MNITDKIYFTIKDWVSNKITDVKYRFIRNFTFKQKLIKEIHGSKMFLNLNETGGIVKDLTVHGTREIQSTKLMKRIIKKNDVVIDLGANIGYYVLIESKIVGNKGKVYAIEPVPNNMVLLSHNLFLNHIKNVETFILAIGNKTGTIKMFMSDRCNHCSFIKTINSNDETINCKMITLNRFVIQNNITRLDFLRMDIEGYETDVIKGGWETIKRFKPKMFIEIHSKQTSKIRGKSIKVMLKKLRDMGYETTQVVCASRLENMGINDLINDDRVKDETEEERNTGRKAGFEVFFEYKGK